MKATSYAFLEEDFREQVCSVCSEFQDPSEPLSHCPILNDIRSRDKHTLRGIALELALVEVVLFGRPLAILVERLSYYRRLRKVWSLIETSYSVSDLKLEEVESSCSISRNYLNTLLKRCTTLTFHQLLVRYRLYRAIYTMVEANYSLLEITLSTGFKSDRTFTRAFRRHLRDRPGRFRKDLRDKIARERISQGVSPIGTALRSK